MKDKFDFILDWTKRLANVEKLNVIQQLRDLPIPDRRSLIEFRNSLTEEELTEFQTIPVFSGRMLTTIDWVVRNSGEVPYITSPDIALASHFINCLDVAYMGKGMDIDYVIYKLLAKEFYVTYKDVIISRDILHHRMTFTSPLPKKLSLHFLFVHWKGEKFRVMTCYHGLMICKLYDEITGELKEYYHEYE